MVPEFPSESPSMYRQRILLTIAVVASASYRTPPSWDGGVGIRLCSDDQRPSPRLSRHHTHPIDMLEPEERNGICHSLSDVIIDFLQLFTEGKETRIIDKMNILRVNVFT